MIRMYQSTVGRLGFSDRDALSTVLFSAFVIELRNLRSFPAQRL